jgi:nucleoside phosphorylase
MLNDEHEDIIHDATIYKVSRIGGHYVVIACLPKDQTGTNSATAVAVQIKAAFPSIQFGLMVGIRGGVPTADTDIRLGDVVVSQPSKVHGGVVQFDFGKATPKWIQANWFSKHSSTNLASCYCNSASQPPQREK